MKHSMVRVLSVFFFCLTASVPAWALDEGFPEFFGLSGLKVDIEDQKTFAMAKSRENLPFIFNKYMSYNVQGKRLETFRLKELDGISGKYTFLEFLEKARNWMIRKYPFCSRMRIERPGMTVLNEPFDCLMTFRVECSRYGCDEGFWNFAMIIFPPGAKVPPPGHNIPTLIVNMSLNVSDRAIALNDMMSDGREALHGGKQVGTRSNMGMVAGKDIVRFFKEIFGVR